ncbi:hypothetical protein CVT25_005286 [Psilocybe cyanescens]|uniref:HAT C-terminal dimerisation domain-containing protein n=1 Tax=Psilocybe cyanescens TaxID=93625 RepID=A0A409XBW1_PSICY|nr:hypothetical protein CVT25_005286 [Psilocybe cyanescens]
MTISEGRNKEKSDLPPLPLRRLTKSFFDTEQLAKEWTAGVYGFFRPDPIIECISGHHAHTFICAATHCRGPTRNIRRFLDTKDAKSTSNLHQHALKCWGEDNVEAAQSHLADEVHEATKGASPSGSITAAFKRKGKGKISYSHRQHTKTETRAEIVHWVAESSRPLNIVKDRGFQSLMKTGRPEYWIPSPSTDHPGALSFATDAWSSPNHRAYVAVTVHFEQDGIPVSMLLNIVKVPHSHSGLNLAKAFADILEDFGISDKILSITSNNASNNGTMIVELSKLIPSFPGESNLTRCFNHVLSLVAKTAIRVFDVSEAVKDTIDERLALLEVEQEALDKSVLPVRLLLIKLRKFSYAIIHSTTLLLPEWFLTLKDTKLDERMMPRDVSTRWNSTYDMLKFAIDYRKAIDRLMGDKNLGLRQYELSDDEWEIAKQLSLLLMIFKEATLFFLRSTPNIPTVLPAMDHIDKWLTTASVNSKLPASIRTATGLSKKTLNRYYKRSDCSKVYCIAMVKFEEPSIALTAQAQKKNASLSTNIFDTLPAFSAMPSFTEQDELSRYLAEDIIPMKPQDALSWWASKMNIYPRLSRMALDYLSIPATSVDVEHVFSRGRILLSHLRNRTSPQTTRALMCLQVWSILGYVKNKDMLSVTRLPETQGDDDEDLDDGWDDIKRKYIH